MKTKIRAPSHFCPKCGEWWVVEPVEQDIWSVMRFCDHTRMWNELTFTPVCPDCKSVVLHEWLLDD